MSILNQMRKNPALTAAGFLFIVALIVLIGWLVTRGKKGASGLPELTVSGEKTVKSIKKSEYSIMREYALGDHLGDNIDFKLTLDTKSGFDENNIVKIVAKRFNSENENIVLDEIVIPNITNYATFTVEFRGESLTKDAVSATGGTNIFKLIGYTKDDNVEYTPTNPLASKDVKISDEDLNYTLNELKVSEFSFSLDDDANATILNVDSSKISRSEYYLSIVPNQAMTIIPVVGSAGLFSFQYADEKTTFFTAGTNTTDFKLDKSHLYEGVYRLYYGDKMVTKSNGEIVLKEPNKMTSEEAEESLIYISDTPLPRTRQYPPKPYPSAASGDNAVNDYSWEVKNADYGNGIYKVKADSSLWAGRTDVNFDGQLDAEGFFDMGAERAVATFSAEAALGLIEGKAVNEEIDYHAYHSVEFGAAVSFDFTLPVNIKLAGIEIFPRSYSNTEILNMESSWTIEGIGELGGVADGATTETLLTANNVIFEKDKKKKLYNHRARASNKYNKFKVTMEPLRGTYMVFNEILFYGMEV